ncbi:DNA-binding MarR family transcriptional regulator [Ruminiclostridium sufflavum DSM 19573]|uniref:DNA-binding MarR family transcriptional regulator n=2 Tax=Ruminiclostridium TaxID=1508657 RepID=A0A318XJ19_9FIRM|nr:MarR family transcriptional regulator [Ruminiclostridium sufflavum]PYG87230.1 DNA-binding MarR family transcriptional regulator [Ruminiclostridium sufflavum DSM 19573]
MYEDIMYFIKLNNKIFRATQIYLDKLLRKYDLSSGSYQYLFILNKNEGISQNKISKELGFDKAMSARTITKLIEVGYIVRLEDDTDSRAYKLFLSEKAKAVIPKILTEIHKLVELITADLSEQEKIITTESLKKILINLRELK